MNSGGRKCTLDTRGAVFYISEMGGLRAHYLWWWTFSQGGSVTLSSAAPVHPTQCRLHLLIHLFNSSARSPCWGEGW